MEERKTPASRVILSLLIATMIFSAGFLFGNTIVYLKNQEIAQEQQNINFDLLSMQLETQFIDTCSSSTLPLISQTLDEMGSEMTILEQRFGKNDPRVLEQKQKYTLLQVQHFLNIKEYQQKCEEVDTVFFFYSNTETYQDEGERIGFILQDVKQSNPDKTMIYSFDYNLDQNIIKILKELYGITAPNSIVINEDQTVYNLKDSKQLKEYLD